MYIPAAREHVEILGRSGVFFVLAVNLESQFASVIPLDSGVYVDDVRFTMIRPHQPSARRESTDREIREH